jgi:hypothetical protein
MALAGFVLEGDRVVAQIAEVRRGTPPVRLTVTIGPPEDPQDRAWIDLHPSGGWRIRDEQGRTWIGRGSRVLRGEQSDPPVGLVESWLLVTSEERELTRLLGQVGIDLRRSRLARCGDADCFVLGAREGESQIWVEKSRFEIRKYVDRRGMQLDFDRYRRGVRSLRLPSRVLVVDAAGSIAEVLIQEAEAAPRLSSDPDLSR